MKYSDKSTSIYGLIDPRTHELRYIGKTVKTIASRLGEHIGKARRGGKTHRCNWIRSILANGLKPEAVDIETIPSGGNWAEAESFWVAYFNAVGCRLTNLTEGGDGTVGYQHSDATKAAISQIKQKLFSDDPARRLEHGQKIRKAAPQAKSLSGFRGVTKEGSRWRAAVKIQDKTYFLGHFELTESGRLNAARACDRFESASVGVGNFLPRCPDAMEDMVAWSSEHVGLGYDKVSKVLRLEAKKRAPVNKNNKSGFRGVTLHKKAQKWQARTFLNGRAHSVGLYPYTNEGKVAAASALDAFERAKVSLGNFAPRLSNDFNLAAENDNIKISGEGKAA